MNFIYKALSSSMAFMGVVIMCNAQVNAYASASATVVTPLSIEKIADLNFGNLSIAAATGGTVILDAGGARLNTGGVATPQAVGEVSSASFKITGSGSYSYNISLPSTITLLRISGSETMTASAFTSNPSTTGTLSAGAQSLAVGATLTVAAAQAPGIYTSSNFEVTVNYN